MRTAIALLVLVALAAGCTREGARGTMAIGGLAVVGGIALSVGSAVDRAPFQDGAAPGMVFGTALLLLGLSLVLGGVVGLGTEPEPTPTPAVLAAERHRSQVADLTARAIAAANVGQCKVVHALDVRMQTLDREAHANAFARIEPIRICLERR